MDNFSDFTQIKGLGDKRIETLKKAGISSPLDLLMLFPRAYYDRNVKIPWNELSDGETVVFEGKIMSKPSLARIRRGLSVVRVKTESGGMSLGCTWFNQDYIFRAVAEGQIKLFVGKVKKFKRTIEISSPQIYNLRKDGITPIYRLPKGIPQNIIGEVCKSVLDSIRLTGYIDIQTAEKFGLPDIKQALIKIHFPQSIEEADYAKKSIALQQLAYTVSVYSIAKNNRQDKRAFCYITGENEVKKAIKELPFVLTADQQQALDGIFTRLKSKDRLNILLQGDVGSGKTIIVFLCAYFASLNGYQTAIMAPTDVLAMQHYINAIEFFEQRGIKVGYISGGQSKSERETALFNIKNGAVKVIIGTHAIISKQVEFDNLALSIVDEQHKFGVCQRGSLENKTECADNIVMSATPIPRTLALTLYGELQQISIRSKPIKENNIKTAIVPAEKMDDMYNYIIKKALLGEKTFIVCPRVDSEDSVSAVGLFGELKSGKLKNVKIGLLHGQMKESEKTSILGLLAGGDISVLICTSVIEVGIDIKDATTMVILGAERFGLSQLHQLRGRVGRDGQESYCFVCEEKASSTERLKYLCECNDGFKLAEYDFNIRGAGDFLGTRQHGDESVFAGVAIDADIIRRAKALSEIMLSNKETAEALKASVENGKEFIKELTLS